MKTVTITKRSVETPLLHLRSGDADSTVIRLRVPISEGENDITGMTWSVRVQNDHCEHYDSYIGIPVLETENDVTVEWNIPGSVCAVPGFVFIELIGTNASGDVWKSGIRHIEVHCALPEEVITEEEYRTEHDLIAEVAAGVSADIIRAREYAKALVDTEMEERTGNEAALSERIETGISGAKNYAKDIVASEEYDRKADTETAKKDRSRLAKLIEEETDGRIDGDASTLDAAKKIVSDTEKAINGTVSSMGTELRNLIEKEGKERSEEDTLINARIKNIMQLPAGANAGQAEIIDARIDVDGVTHDGLGDSIRSQIRKLNGDVSDTISGFGNELQGVKDLLGFNPVNTSSGTVENTWKNGFVAFRNYTFKAKTKYTVDVTITSAQSSNGYVYILNPDGTQKTTFTFNANSTTRSFTLEYDTDTTLTAVCGWSNKGFGITVNWYVTDRSTRLDVDKQIAVLADSVDMLGDNGTRRFNPVHFAVGYQTVASNNVVVFTTVKYLVGSTKAFLIEKDLNLNVAEGYRIYSYYVNENGVLTGNSGWKTGNVTVPAGKRAWFAIDWAERDTSRQADIVEMLSAVTILSSRKDRDLEEIERRIDALETQDVEYASEYHEAEDKFLNDIRNDVDANTLVFMLSTDDHYNETNTSSGGDQMVKHAGVKRILSEKIGVDFMLNLGDIIDEDTVNGNTIRVDAMRKAYTSTYIPFLYALGHHEMYPTISHSHQGHADNVTTYTYESDKVLGKLGRQNRYIAEKHYSADSASESYYVDFEMQRIRLIVLDSVHNTYCGFTQDVVSFCNEAFSNVPSGYKVIMAAHVPTRNTANWDGVDVQNGSQIESIIESFISGGGTVMGYFHGHTHWDNVVKDSDMHFNLISTCCGRPSYTPVKEHGPDKGVSGNPIAAANRTGSGLREYCCDVVCVHPDTNTIRMFRWGASGNGASTATNGVRTINA